MKLTKLEAALVEAYYPSFQSMLKCSNAEARNQIIGVLGKIREEAQTGGTSNAPPNLGDILLANEKTDQKIQAHLSLIRSEGANDSDFCTWWNKSDTERRLIMKIDEAMRIGLFLDQKRNGVGPKEAAEHIRKCCVIYGDVVEDEILKGDDKPLPWELRARVQEYIARRVRIEEFILWEEVSQSPSINSYVRKHLRLGHL